MTSPSVEISSFVSASIPAASKRGLSRTRARLLPVRVRVFSMSVQDSCLVRTRQWRFSGPRTTSHDSQDSAAAVFRPAVPTSTCAWASAYVEPQVVHVLETAVPCVHPRRAGQLSCQVQCAGSQTVSLILEASRPQTSSGKEKSQVQAARISTTFTILAAIMFPTRDSWTPQSRCPRTRSDEYRSCRSTGKTCEISGAYDADVRLERCASRWNTFPAKRTPCE